MYELSYRAIATNSNEVRVHPPGRHRGSEKIVVLWMVAFRQKGKVQEPARFSCLRVSMANGFVSGKISEERFQGQLMPKFEKHIFICGNQRPAGHPRGCCDPLAEARLQKLFKQKLAARGLKGRVRANQSGCLDQCEHGPNVVVYPDAVWYGRVSEADVEEIVESHILGGRPVERLRLPEECLNTASCQHRPPKT